MVEQAGRPPERLQPRTRLKKAAIPSGRGRGDRCYLLGNHLSYRTCEPRAVDRGPRRQRPPRRLGPCRCAGSQVAPASSELSLSAPVGAQEGRRRIGQRAANRLGGSIVASFFRAGAPRKRTAASSSSGVGAEATPPPVTNRPCARAARFPADARRAPKGSPAPERPRCRLLTPPRRRRGRRSPHSVFLPCQHPPGLLGRPEVHQPTPFDGRRTGPPRARRERAADFPL